jgi:hypothetical protein
MPVWQRVLAYGAVVAVVFAAAVGIGRAVGPIEGDEAAHADAHTDDHAEEHSSEHSSEAAQREHAYQMVVEDNILDPGRSRLRFTILDETGLPVTSYDLQHEKRLHLVVVSNDLSQYRHVHPTLDPDTGLWSVPVTLGPGSWALYADFVPAGGEQTVLGSGVDVAGDYRPVELGADELVSRVDGYEVHLERSDAGLTLHVTRGGEDVTDLEPYLGAYGHLVAIRVSDLTYLHVHPEEGGPGPEIAFHAELADAGRYRLFLDFKHGGRVHTADFTITVDDDGEEGAGGHDH